MTRENRSTDKHLTHQGDMSVLVTMTYDLYCTVNFLLKLKDMKKSKRKDHGANKELKQILNTVSPVIYESWKRPDRTCFVPKLAIERFINNTNAARFQGNQLLHFSFNFHFIVYPKVGEKETIKPTGGSVNSVQWGSQNQALVRTN